MSDLMAMVAAPSLQPGHCCPQADHHMNLVLYLPSLPAHSPSYHVGNEQNKGGWFLQHCRNYQYICTFTVNYLYQWRQMKLLVPGRKKGDSIFPEDFLQKGEVGLDSSVSRGDLLNMTWNCTWISSWQGLWNFMSYVVFWFNYIPVLIQP